MLARPMMRLLALTAAALGFAAIAVAQPPGTPPAQGPGAGGMSSEAGAGGAPKMPETMKLTEAQVSGFIAATQELQTIDPKEALSLGAGLAKPKSSARAEQVSSEAQAILKKNGFESPKQFQQVGFNAALALALLEQGGKEAMQRKLGDAERQQAKALEQMRQHLSPEQFKPMQKQLEAGMALMHQMQNVPDGNLELAKKYEKQLKALGAKK